MSQTVPSDKTVNSTDKTVNSTDKTVNSTDKTVNSTDKTVNSSGKKSKTWLWILLGGLLIFVVIIVVIIIIAVFGGFSKSETPDNPPNTNTCSSSITQNTTSYNSNDPNLPEPYLVSTGPNYLTNSGVIAGSTNNKQIKTEDALGWIIINNSSDSIQLYFYYIDSNNQQQTLYTMYTGAGSSIDWKGSNNLNKPAFIGMTLQFYNSTEPQKFSANKYAIPSSGINPATDILVLTYNADNTMTGSLCTSVS